MLGGDNIVARLQKGVSEKFNDLVRTIAEHDVIDAHAQISQRCRHANDTRRHPDKNVL